MLFADLRYDYVRTDFAKLADLDFARYEETFVALEKQGRAAVAKARVRVSEIRVTRALDMRYVGQEHLVTIDVPVKYFERHDRAAIKTLFDKEHECARHERAHEAAEIASPRKTQTGCCKTTIQARSRRRCTPPSMRSGTRQPFWLVHRRSCPRHAYGQPHP